jgi:hypothetical protein
MGIKNLMHGLESNLEQGRVQLLAGDERGVPQVPPPAPKTTGDLLLSEMKKQTKCLEQVRDAAVLVKWIILLALLGSIVTVIGHFAFLKQTGGL